MENDWLAQDCLYIDKREPVGRIIGCLKGDRKEIAIIEDHGKPYAIVDARAAMRRGLRKEMAIEKMAWPVPTIQGGEDDATVLERFAVSGATQLPAYLGRPPRKMGYLDANHFLQKAFTEGPGAATAAQGLPNLWPDATIEDAVQSFAASHLPILPIVGADGIDGIIRRESVLPYLEGDNPGMGRRDVAGNRDALRGENIEALIEPYRAWLSPQANFVEIQAALLDEQCIFVDHGTVQAITPTSILQAIHAGNQIPAANERTHFRQARHN